MNIAKLIVLFYLCLCFYNCKVTKSKSIVTDKENPCLQGGTTGEIDYSMVFEPFKQQYFDFLESDSEFHIIVMKTKRTSAIYELKKIGDNMMEFKKSTKLNSSSQKIPFQETIVLDAKMKKYFFLCNTDSSDLGSHIYLVKYNSEVIATIWVDNGDFWDLPKNDFFIELEKFIKLMN